MRVLRVVVLQLKRIGDLLLTAPALASLRRRCPTAEITLVVPEGMRALAECIAGVDQVLEYGGVGRIGVWTTLLWGDWDVCLDFTGTDRSALLTGLSGAVRRLGYRRSSEGLKALVYTERVDASVRELHTVDLHEALVERVARLPVGVEAGVVLRIPQRVREAVAVRMEAEGLGAGYVLMHPGTARREKFWPVERWIALGEWLSSAGHRVVVTGTGTGLEAGDVRQLLAADQVPWVDLTGQLSLPELAEWVRRSDAAVGVDSMAMHMAALWERPQVVLFGPTNPFHWRPRHVRAHVLTPSQSVCCERFEPRMPGGEMNQISTQAAIDATRCALAGNSSVARNVAANVTAEKEEENQPQGDH